MRKLAVIFLVGALTGCGDPGLRIDIEGTGAIDTRLSGIEVTLTALQHEPFNEQGQLDPMLVHTCIPSSQEFTSDPGVDFPVSVTIRSGEIIDWKCVAVRVQGFERGNSENEVIRVEELYCPEDFYEEAMVETLRLYGDCFEACGEGFVCDPTAATGDAPCVASTLASIFDDVAPAVDQECWAR